MWKEVKISEKTYFIYCNFNENTQDITFVLYDFQITWCQTVHFKDVKQKVKLLNKRFDFNEDNIKEALTSDAIQSAILEDTKNSESCLLKIKYRVKNCLLSYEWCLRKQNLLEFQQTIVQPILLTLLECQQQIEILADSIRKKDIELKQFRIEGAVLNRKTLVTKPFDFDDFKTKFENCNKVTNNFKDLAKYIKEAEWSVRSEVLNKNEKHTENRTEGNVKSDDNKGGGQAPNLKISPKQNRKRKANEIKMDHLQQHLKLCRQGLEYESSQSQTQNSSSSQTIEESGLKDTAECLLSSRKNTRFSKLKQNQSKMSNNDKRESDYEDCLKIPSEKRIKKCLDSRKSDSRVSNDQEFKAKSKSVSLKETKQINVKSLSLSNKTRKDTSGESIGSNVFDFFTESDDEIPLLKRTNSQKNNIEQNSQKLKRKSLTNKTSLSINKSSLPDSESVNSVKSPSANNSLGHGSTPVIINEISSQLDNIKKELETLEAMRLADLQQRVCKV